MKLTRSICKIVLASVISSAPAFANGRDEAFATAFACGVIGDNRIWLDCYYGAAQSVRAQLGLSPALTNQIELASKPPVGNVPEAVSVFRSDILSSASTCRSITDDRDWLSCFYAAASPMRAKLGLQPASQTASHAGTNLRAPVPYVAEGATQEFGSHDALVKSIQSRMVSFNFDASGIFTVRLANGQVWRQISGDTRLAHWTGEPEKYVVVISHGFFGSFNLGIQNTPGIFKVRRVM